MHQGPGDTRPLREQRLSPPGRKREVHVRRRAPSATCVLFQRMKEIAVSVDVHQAPSTRQTSCIQATQKQAAIPPYHEGESIFLQLRSYGSGKIEQISAQGMTIADPRARLRARLVVGAR